MSARHPHGEAIRPAPLDAQSQRSFGPCPMHCRRCRGGPHPEVMTACRGNKVKKLRSNSSASTTTQGPGRCRSPTAGWTPGLWRPLEKGLHWLPPLQRWESRWRWWSWLGSGCGQQGVPGDDSEEFGASISGIQPREGEREGSTIGNGGRANENPAVGPAVCKVFFEASGRATISWVVSTAMPS